MTFGCIFVCFAAKNTSLVIFCTQIYQRDLWHFASLSAQAPHPHLSLSGPAPLHILWAAILLRNLLRGKIHYKYRLIQQSETFLKHIQNIRVDNICPAIWLQSFLKYSWTLQGNAFCLIGSIYLAESYKVECGTYCEAQLLQLVLDVHLRMENFHVNFHFKSSYHSRLSPQCSVE